MNRKTAKLTTKLGQLEQAANVKGLRRWWATLSHKEKGKARRVMAHDVANAPAIPVHVEPEVTERCVSVDYEAGTATFDDGGAA